MRKMKKLISLLSLILSTAFICAQPVDTLLKIDGHIVDSEEFMRIYNKNSSIAEENQKSIDEYLDLFINYKLKVVEAENLGYDTTDAFVNEIRGYTQQLARPYMEMNNSLDSFVLEGYQRMQEEINASHILLKLHKNSLPADTARVYNRLIALREQLIAGKDWDQLIIDESPDPENPIGGDLGWFTAFRMVYPFETVAYNTPVGEISMPVRTEYGYHLVRVNDRRPARGDVKASHIMVFVRRNPSLVDKEAALNKINKAYEALESGEDWNDVAREYSEHEATKKRGGYLGYINPNNAPEEMLDELFKLDTFEYSKPFLTRYGYHIARPEEFRPIPSFEEAEESVRSKVKNTGDISDITKEQQLQRIKDEYGFNFDEEKLNPLYALADSDMYAGTWDPKIASDLLDTVFYIGDTVYTQFDIAKAWSSRRVTGPFMDIEILLRQRVLRLVDQKVEEYGRDRLPEKYPEYKHLLQEYHDGILLFNLTEEKVWKKAVEDSAGLQRFYDGLPEKYMWEKRIAFTKYTYSDSSLTDALIQLAKKRAAAGQDAVTLSSLLCPEDSLPCVSFTELKYEQGDNAVADSLTWKKGRYLTSSDDDGYVLYMVDAILKPTEKTLEDARGLYTADYQTQLEKEWIAGLRQKYTVDVNEELLNTLKAENEQLSDTD